MLVFVDVSIKGYSLDSFVVSWSVAANPAADDISDYRYHVGRSLSPEGPFDRVTPTDGLSSFSFEDRQVNRYSKLRQWYYRIEAEADGKETVISSYVNLEIKAPTQVELIRNEIKRNQLILLRGVGITPGTFGIPCLLYIRKTFGQRCRCWDNLQKQVSDERCVLCYSVGYTGGYMDPIVVHVNIGGAVETSNGDQINEGEERTAEAWMVNYPEVTRGDLLITKDNYRMTVTQKTGGQLRGELGRQRLSLSVLTRTDIRYKMPIREDLLEGSL